jgi:serine protease Do
MTRSDPAPESASVAVVSHLSGRFRGKTARLASGTIRIGTADDAEIRIAERDLPAALLRLPGSGPLARIVRVGDGFELQAAESSDVWVNGSRAFHIPLSSGDVLEIGEGGPVLRFRVYPPGSEGFKSVADVFSDCLQCVRHARNPLDRAGVVLAGPATELLTRTAPRVRAAVALAMLSPVVAVAAVWLQGRQLEARLDSELEAVHRLSEIAAHGEDRLLSDKDVQALRANLRESTDRIAALEHRSDARARVIEMASRSVVFIQGAWGFEAPDGRPLRFAAGADGAPLQDPTGPRLTIEGLGPEVEILFTGTGFVIHSDGLVLTNRHVAEPWKYEELPPTIEAGALRPVMRRLRGYLPELAEPFDLHLVRTSEKQDAALLRCDPVGAGVVPLARAGTVPRVGDEIVVLGYPTGIAALVARAEAEVVERLRRQGPLDFWSVAAHLSREGLIAPLATAGVVGQLSPSSIVYDAETTHGGSGGPVLNLAGGVVAMNTAILPEFGGSNLGVPAEDAYRLLLAGEAENDRTAQPVED